MKNSHKVVFWIIIGVFVLSSFLAFASFSIIGNPNSTNTQKEPLIISQEERDAQTAAKIESQYGKSLEGILHKAEEGKYEEGTHYLEVDGVMITLLEASDKSINLDKYIDKNVKVWGETNMTQKGDNIIMKVTKIE